MHHTAIQIVQFIDNLLQEDQWSYTLDSRRNVFHFWISLSSVIKSFHYIITVRDNSIVVYGVCPIGPDSQNAEQMRLISEFLCRANFGLRNGCFELDFNNGEICYKSYIDCQDSHLSKNALRDSISCIYLMLKRYLPGIISLLLNQDTPQQAIERCETSNDFFIELLSLLANGNNASDEDIDSLDHFSSADPEDNEDWSEW